jgi:hypothetical protein
VEKEKTTEIYMSYWQGQNSSTLLSIQTGYGAYPASYSIGTGNTFPVAKARVQLGCER